jgi:uncharacterized membrane protein YcjF (UPF0283 family)
MVFNELKHLWRIGCRIAVIVGVLLSFFAVMEVVRAYQTLRDVNVGLGYGFLAMIGGALVWGVWYFWSAFRGYPKVLVAPPRENVRKYCKYMQAYLGRLAINEALTEEEQAEAKRGREELGKKVEGAGGKEDLEAAIEQVESQSIEPLLKKLDERAEQKIRGGVRDIMLAVTLSPYRSVDLLIVLWRNLSMVRNVALVYNSRPRLKETLGIVYDTARVVATVNFVNLGSRMIENFTKGLPGMIPGVSRIVDDCAEGLAAGVLTSVTGHAAKDRCRAFRRWNYEEAKENMATHIKTFSSDVGKMFYKDIMPNVKIPGEIAKEKWKEFTNSIARGFSETVEVIQSYIRGESGPKKS